MEVVPAGRCRGRTTGRTTPPGALRARVGYAVPRHAAGASPATSVRPVKRLLSRAMSDEREPRPRVAIIGAGFSGLCLGIRLKQAGIDPFTIYEKADRLGGTWRDNTYPGAACDVPSFAYCFSFAQKTDWTRKWSPQAEILAY